MEIAGLTFLGLGGVGWLVSSILEIRARRPVYELLWKLFAVTFGIGGVLWAIGV